MHDELRLHGFENSQHSRRTTEMKVTAAVGRDVLAVTGAGAEEVAELVMAATEALGGGEAVEAAHTSRAPFDAAVILLKPVTLLHGSENETGE
jgi:hypothetical protein